jgi:hypothetical protein
MFAQDEIVVGSYFSAFLFIKNGIIRSVADPDSGSGMGKKIRIRVRIRKNNQDHISESLETNFWNKILNISGTEKNRIRKNIMDPQH